MRSTQGNCDQFPGFPPGAVTVGIPKSRETTSLRIKALAKLWNQKLRRLET